MLRVGLTGELGSGKSTVARMLAEHGAVVLSSDEMGRAMMQPGQSVYQAIVEHFGPPVVLPDGQLNRPELARLAFDPVHPRVEELNAIIHPAVIAEQERRIAEIQRTQPDAIVVVESALILTTKHAGTGEPWRKRFDRILVVIAPDEVKVSRFIERNAGAQPTPEQVESLRTDALKRLAAQRIPPTITATLLSVSNSGDLASLEQQVSRVWLDLSRDTRTSQDQTRNPSAALQ